MIFVLRPKSRVPNTALLQKYDSSTLSNNINFNPTAAGGQKTALTFSAHIFFI